MKNQKQNTTKTSSSTKGWDAGDIFSANFMFPTDHFENCEELNDVSEEEFSKLSVDILETIQPLSEDEKQMLTASVKSGNRLRVYYQILTLVDKRASIENEVNKKGCEGASMKDTYDGKLAIVDADHIINNEPNIEFVLDTEN